METIDTEEKFKSWKDTLSTHATNMNVTTYSVKLSSNKPWWAQREDLRITNGLYRSTEVTHWINNYFPVFAHVSQTDPTQVAFTPDAACGERDKQIKTTIGRLIQKLIPIASQEFIQQKVDEHISEVNMEILFASKQEITDMYIKHPRSNGCMSNTNKFTDKYHPTLAYHTNNIRLAYVKAGESITHRSLVYENGDDKRFFRCYPSGDTGFKRKLIEMGYKAGNWVGAELNLVKIPDIRNKNKVVLPYLDAYDSHADNSVVAIIDGKLRVLDSSMRNILDPNQTRNGANTDGFVYLDEVDSQDFTKTCQLSGKEYSLLNRPDIVTAFVNGEQITALQSEIPSDWVVRGRIHTAQLVHTDPKNVVTILDSYSNSQFIVATEEELKEYKYVPMVIDDKTYYIQEHNVVQIDGKYVYKRYTTLYHSYKNGVLTSMYAMTNTFNRRSCYKTNSGEYITKDSDYLITTSGKKVVPGVDNFYKLENGSVVLRKPGYSYYFAGKRHYFATHVERDAWIATEPKKMTKAYFANLEEDVNKYLPDIYNYIPNNIYPRRDFTNMTFEQIINSPNILQYATSTLREVILELREELVQRQQQQTTF